MREGDLTRLRGGSARPPRIAGHVGDDDPLFAKSRRAAGAHVRADRQRRDGPSPGAGHPGAGCRPQPPAVRIHQQDRRNDVGILGVNRAAQILQSVIEARPGGDHFQRSRCRSEKGCRPRSNRSIGFWLRCTSNRVCHRHTVSVRLRIVIQFDGRIRSTHPSLPLLSRRANVRPETYTHQSVHLPPRAPNLHDCPRSTEH